MYTRHDSVAQNAAASSRNDTCTATHDCGSWLTPKTNNATAAVERTTLKSQMSTDRSHLRSHPAEVSGRARITASIVVSAPSVIRPCGAGPCSAGPCSAGPGGARPPRTRPSGTRPSGTRPCGARPCCAGPRRTVECASGPRGPGELGLRHGRGVPPVAEDVLLAGQSHAVGVDDVEAAPRRLEGAQPGRSDECLSGTICA